MAEQFLYIAQVGSSVEQMGGALERLYGGWRERLIGAQALMEAGARITILEKRSHILLKLLDSFRKRQGKFHEHIQISGPQTNPLKLL